MRHATAETLKMIEPLLEEIGSVPGLVEKRPGIFYRRSMAFLHFHEDSSGLHAGVRFDEDFERVRAETVVEQKALMVRIRALRPVSSDRRTGASTTPSKTGRVLSSFRRDTATDAVECASNPR
jgi:hypothetical protein